MLNKELYEKYKPQRQELNRLFYTEKNYEECLKQIREFERLLIHDGIIDKYNHRFMHMMYSKSYYRLKNVALAIRHGEIALKLSQDKNEEAFAYWALRNAYELTNKNKAVMFNEICEEYYKEKNETYSLADAIGEKGLLLNDSKYVLEAINLFNKVSNFEKYMTTKEDKLDEQYTNLFNIYLNGHDKNKHSKMCDLLHKINNPKLKIELSHRIFRLIAV